MATRYRRVPRDQAFLLPPDMRDWLPGGHPVWLGIEVVDRHLDASAVHATRRAGGAGGGGYERDMLAALLVWAYANRVTSSRRIEGLCRTDIAFKVICAGQVPDHVTIARFRAGLGGAAGALFDQVLMLCARLGMGQLGLVTLDGMKIAASASKSANRTEDGLRKLAAEMTAWKRRTAAKTAVTGWGRGGGLPQRPVQPCGVRQAAAWRKKAEAAAGAAGQDPPASTSNAKGRGKGKKGNGEGEGRGPVRNVTDPHSRLMPTRRGVPQGYNTQNLPSPDGPIILPALTASPTHPPPF